MAIADTVWGRLARFNPPRQQIERQRPHEPFSVLRLIAALRWLVVLVVLGLVGWGGYWEMQNSQIQAMLFEKLNGGMSFAVKNGRSEAVRFPKSGPYDERLGYVQLPQFISSLSEHRFQV